MKIESLEGDLHIQKFYMTKVIVNLFITDEVIH